MTRNRGNIVIREKDLALSFRVNSKERRLNFMGKEFSLQLDVYWDAISFFQDSNRVMCQPPSGSYAQSVFFFSPVSDVSLLETL